jgi:hypothetical protein
MTIPLCRKTSHNTLVKIRVWSKKIENTKIARHSDTKKTDGTGFLAVFVGFYFEKILILTKVVAVFSRQIGRLQYVLQY